MPNGGAEALGVEVGFWCTVCGLRLIRRCVGGVNEDLQRRVGWGELRLRDRYLWTHVKKTRERIGWSDGIRWSITGILQERDGWGKEKMVWWMDGWMQMEGYIVGCAVCKLDVLRVRLSWALWGVEKAVGIWLRGEGRGWLWTVRVRVNKEKKRWW